MKTALAMLVCLGLMLTATAFADPVVSNGFPVCGVQGDPSFVSNCSDYVPATDQQFITVPGTGPVTVTFASVFRDAAFSDEVYAVKVDDSAGTIGTLHPGDAGYLAAVQGRAQLVIPGGFTPALGDAVHLTFNGGDKVMFVVSQSSLSDTIANNPTNDPSQNFHVTWFSIDSANPDHADHMLAWSNTKDGSGQFAFEDWVANGGDYNDVAFDATTSTTTVDWQGNGDGDQADASFGGSACGAAGLAGASGDVACSASGNCGAGGTWRTITGYATWSQLVTGLTFWRYDASFRVCFNPKKQAILAYTGNTQVPSSVLAPIWSYDNKPVWSFGPVGSRVSSSIVRVTDSFTACPLVNIFGALCHTVHVTISWSLHGDTGLVNKSVSFS